MSAARAASLRAALDEDEAAAKAVEDNSEPWTGQWEDDGGHAVRTYNGWVLAHGSLRPGFSAHVARHDPARTLRMVAACRAILDLHDAFAAEFERQRLDPSQAHPGSGITAATKVLGDVVRILAEAYGETGHAR